MDVSSQLFENSMNPAGNPYQNNSNNFYNRPKGFAEDRLGFWPK